MAILPGSQLLAIADAWPEPALIAVYIAAGIVAVILLLSLWGGWWGAPRLFKAFPLLFLPPLFLLNVVWVLGALKPMRYDFLRFHTKPV